MFRRFSLISSTVFLTLAIGQANRIEAQTILPPPPPPMAIPTPKLPQIPAPNLQAADVSRQTRQASYAKLLEGQHYLWIVQRFRTQAGIGNNAKLARQALQRAVELNPKLSEGYTALSELSFITQNDLNEAERLANFAVQINPNSFGGHKLLARIYTIQSKLNVSAIDQNFADKAVTQWLEITKLDSRNAEAWALLSEFYARTKQTDKRIEALKRWNAAANPIEIGFFRSVTGGQDLSPDAATIPLGIEFLRAGNSAEAVTILSRAIVDDPTNTETVTVLEQAIEISSPETVATAVKSMQQAVFAAPTNIALVQLLANTQKKSGDKEAALTTIRSARLKNADDFNLILFEANSLSDNGQVDEAVSLLRSKIINKTKQVSVPSAVNTDFVAQVTISRILVQAGRGAEAVIAAQQALVLAQDEQRLALGNFTLATAQNAAGDFKSSETTLRSVIKQDPNNATALNNLGYYMVERGERLPEAINLIKRAVEIEPENPSYLDSLGWAHFQLKQYAEAEKYLTDAAQKSTNSATVLEHLGDLYQKQGKLELAKTNWRKALNLSSNSAQITKLKGKLDKPKKVRAKK